MSDPEFEPLQARIQRLLDDLSLPREEHDVLHDCAERIAAQDEQINALKAIKDKYYELLYIDEQKTPGEDRHATAVRYMTAMANIGRSDSESDAAKVGVSDE